MEFLLYIRTKKRKCVFLHEKQTGIEIQNEILKQNVVHIIVKWLYLHFISIV